MFTGIIEERGSVLRLVRSADAAQLTIEASTVLGDVRHGDSIAVSGVCLTVVDSTAESFTADVMGETLHRTSLGALRPGAPVNLERSVTPTSRLGGHVVQGHVDGVGTFLSRTRHPAWDEISVRAPKDLGRYLAPKGAVALDGISLTVVDVVDVEEGTDFTVGVIPETQRATTLGATEPGAPINIEVDVMAKYVERLLATSDGTAAASMTVGTVGATR